MIGRTMDNYFTKANGVVGEEVLKVEGLSVPGVLKDVSFNVRKGEVVGFYGLVGAGRSETMEAIFGVRPYSAGTITLKGEQVKFKGSKEAVKKGIGFVTEDRKQTGLLLPKSCRENMALAALPNIKKGMFVDEDKTLEIYHKYEKIMDIKSPSPEQPIVLLSGGNQQKVIIGKWLCMGPDLVILDEPTRGIDIGAKILILDEPTSSLTEKEVAALFEIIRKLKAQGDHGRLQQDLHHGCRPHHSGAFRR